MRRSLGPWLPAAGAVALFAAFLAVVFLARGDSALVAWDARVADAFISWRSSGWTWAFWVFTLLGDDSLVAPVTVGTALLAWAWGKSLRAAVVAGGMAAGWVAISVAKAAAARARPPAAVALIESPGSYSMPSGHALIAVMLCGLLVYAVLRPGPVGRAGALLVATLVAAGVGLSRVYLGVHWMSDVIAGWSLGGALLTGVLAVAMWWEREGGPGLSRRTRLWDRRSRAVLVVAVAVVMVAAAALTVWAEPLK